MPYHPTPLHAIAATVVMTTGQRDILHAAGNELAALRAERDALRAERDMLREALRGCHLTISSLLNGLEVPYGNKVAAEFQVRRARAALGEGEG